MNCRISLNLMDDYLGGYLDEGARQELEHHLEQCASCQAHFAGDRDLRQRLQTQLTGQPKAGFADRVMQRTVDNHVNNSSHHWSFVRGAVAASIIIAATTVALSFVVPQSDPEQARQMLALHEVKNIALALDSREELKGATITLRLPDNVELQGFPGQQVISWKTDINRGTNLLSLPVVALAEKKGFLVARLEHGNKSKEYTVELIVRNPKVRGGMDRNETIVISWADFKHPSSARLVDIKRGNS